MARETFDRLPDSKKEAILNSGLNEFSTKSYSDAATDVITKNSGISKGLLFHYFGNKKAFYFYCLETAMERLTSKTVPPEGEDFYQILFSTMDARLRLCGQFPREMHLANMAAREMSPEVAEEKNRILAQYGLRRKAESAKTMARAAAGLKLETEDREKALTALSLYVHALMSKYLEDYLDRPDDFFNNRESIQKELRIYLDFMLNGLTGGNRE